MKIFTIGAGRWGSFIAWYLNRVGHNVTLYGPADNPGMQELIKTRKTPIITIPPEMTISTNINDVMDADVVIISIPSQALSGLMQELSVLNIKNKTFVLCMKGIEIGTGRRLSEIATAALDPSCKVAVWVGPGHVQEFTRGRPNCMVIDCVDDDVKRTLVSEFSSDLIRFYYGTDLTFNLSGK